MSFKYNTIQMQQKREIFSKRSEKIIESRQEKTNVLVSDQVRHKPGCTATEDGQRLEILDLGSRVIALSV